MGCQGDCSDSKSFTVSDLDQIARRRVGESDAAVIFWAKHRIEELERQRSRACRQYESAERDLDVLKARGNDLARYAWEQMKKAITPETATIREPGDFWQQVDDVVRLAIRGAKAEARVAELDLLVVTAGEQADAAIEEGNELRKRVTELEAALRKIATDTDWHGHLTNSLLANIATNALEGDG